MSERAPFMTGHFVATTFETHEGVSSAINHWAPTCVGPTHRSRFDLILGTNRIVSECVVEMMTSAPWLVSPEVHKEGVSCAL